MAARRDHDIKVLNGLIETTLDSAEGYREAAQETANPGYRNLFEERATERLRVVNELQGQVRILGGAAQDHGSILAAAHRVFLDLRDRVAGGDQSVIEEVEWGEDFLKRKYAKALEDAELSAAVRDTVVRAYASVRSGHDQAANLKHSLEH